MSANNNLPGFAITIAIIFAFYLLALGFGAALGMAAAVIQSYFTTGG